MIEASPAGAAVRSFMQKRKEDWDGTAQELLSLLNGVVGETAAKEKNWPRRPNTLSGALNRIAPALRKIGIHIEHYRETHAGTRKIKIEYRSDSEQRAETSSGSSASSDETEKSCEIDDIDQSADDDHEHQGDDPLRQRDDGRGDCGDDGGDDGESTVVSTKPLKNKAADSADDADDEIPLCSEDDDDLHGLSGIEAIEEQIRLRAELARKPASCRVRIREIWPPAIKSGSDDDLTDFIEERRL